MDIRVRRALVVGGGIGGLCAAIALRQKHIDVDLIEKEPTWKVWGIGIIHQTNAVRAEAALGVADAVVAAGYAFSGGCIRSAQGEVLRVIPKVAEHAEFAHDVGITRPRLANILLERAVKLGARIRMGATAKIISNNDDGAVVRLSTGEDERYDLVVGADGIYSRLRADLWGSKYNAQFAGQGGWRYNMPRPREVDCVNIFLRTSGGPNAGLMPLADDLLYMWCTSNEDSRGYKDCDTLAEQMVAIVADIGGIYGELRDRYLVDSSQVIYRPFEYVDLPAPWHKGSVVLIGDAAHASTAHLAQGAAQAMEDAVVLAEEVAAGGGPADFLPRWEARRYTRSRWIAETSLLICRFEQGKINDPAINPMALMIEARQRAMNPL